MNSNNPLWRFFASVPLAIFCFIALAITSIIGTVIPQNQIFAYYSDTYGPTLAQLFFIFDFPTMYSSWWFLGLLTLLAINLIVCSIDKYPALKAKVNVRGGAFSKDKVLQQNHVFTTKQPESFDAISFLKGFGWKAGAHTKNGSTLYYAEKTPWSHYGVYLVHLSIITIFIGAGIGSLLGYKGSVMIPELGSADKIYANYTSTAIPLSFEVRADQFDIEYYDTGMPKTYRSKLTILEDGKEMLTTDIVVNKPLKYKGHTFYQASYEGFQTFIVTITDKKTGETKSLRTHFQDQNQWPEKGVQVGVLNAQSHGKHVERIKLWFYAENGEPHTLWFDDKETKDIDGTDYSVSVKQMYATGLQVAKDPGVWVVYLGCLMMLVGLYICFFLSHRKIWILIDGDDLILAGASNKNPVGLENSFNALVDGLNAQLNK